ncbi:MAG: DNA translocase FtsK [Candidatus Berkiellales bacterium]
MKQATTRRSKQTEPLHLNRRFKEGCFILLCSLAIYLLISLFTYYQGDTAWSHSGMSKEIQNSAGRTGAWFSDVLFSLFGYMAYIFPLVLVAIGVFVYRESTEEQNASLIWLVRCLGLATILIATCGLIAMYFVPNEPSLPMSSGGLLGVAVKKTAVAYLNQLGATVILMAFLFIGVTLFSDVTWLQLLSLLRPTALKGLALIKKISLPSWRKSPPKLNDLKTPMASNKTKEAPAFSFEHAEALDEPFPFKGPKKEKPLLTTKVSSVLPFKSIKPKILKPKETAPRSIEKEIDLKNKPSLSLLEQPSEKTPRLGYTTAQLQDLSRLVESRLLEFGIEVKVVGVQPGPVITRFELDLAAGIKVSKITSLAKDLARSLSVVSVRVVEVIPGKSVVGLEIPNVQRELVRLKAVLEDPNYQQATSPLSLALGKDIAGRPVVVDLAKMPHLLVAGTTGSGKSVGLNAMLLSILYKATPEEVKLILIDPKMLELAIYDNIPHLLTPVVTDMKDAANALRWSVAEMERRYQLMAAIGVRNLSGYNQKVANALEAGKPILDPFWLPQSNEKPKPLEKLPYLVVVVDEFADMIMVVGKKVEELITRIAQKARAAGIHLILATQRPSVDVITGLIKANIPTRIAFQVSSRVDSRTILDQSGAEQLLGHGDMLYLPPGVGVPHRIHGAFVSDEEVHKVTECWRQAGTPTYIESVVKSTGNEAFVLDEDLDELYDEALMIITESRKASISLIQRRLKIGYNRAARLIEQMEAEGVVSAVQSNGTREVLAPPPVERG